MMPYTDPLSPAARLRRTLRAYAMGPDFRLNHATPAQMKKLRSTGISGPFGSYSNLDLMPQHGQAQEPQGGRVAPVTAGGTQPLQPPPPTDPALAGVVAALQQQGPQIAAQDRHPYNPAIDQAASQQQAAMGGPQAVAGYLRDLQMHGGSPAAVMGATATLSQLLRPRRRVRGGHARPAGGRTGGGPAGGRPYYGA